MLMLAFLPVLLLASAFISGSETALFSLSAHQRLALARRGNMAGHAVAILLAETRDLLITLMLCNMIANVLFFVISTVLLLRVEHRGDAPAAVLAALSLGSLVTLILVGEVLPKLVANRLPAAWAAIAAVPLLTIHRAIAPLRLVLRPLVITPLARLIAPSQRPGELSAQELTRLLELSAHRGVIHPEEEDMLHGVLDLGRLRVRDIMTPRVDLVTFEIHRPVAELLDLIRAARRSHIPVYDGDLDNVVGMVEARQIMLRRPADAAQLKRLIRQVAFVPELQRADRLLMEFRKRGHNLAIAVDEYGGTAGLVTLEDVAEEMVGDMPGEGDHRGPDIEQLPDGSFRVAAGLSVQDWIGSLGIQRPSVDAVTLGGLVMARLGRLPRVGDIVREGNLLLEVETMDRRRIQDLRVRLAHADPAPAKGGKSA